MIVQGSDEARARARQLVEAVRFYNQLLGKF